MYTGVGEASPRILVVRLGAMGDIIHTLPAVASLKHSFPGSHITWAIAPQWAPLLAGNVFVDRLILLERTSLAGLLRSRRELRRDPFHFAVDFQGLIKSAPGGLSRRARPHFRIRPLARARKTRGAVLLELRGAFVEARGGSQPRPGARGVTARSWATPLSALKYTRRC